MKKIILLLLFATLLTPSSIYALGDRDANLYFSQTPMNVKLGENFSTSLLIGSNTQAVNAFEAIIDVPENLKIISANYDGSVCQLYIYQPKIYSNKVDFKCGLPHGYQGPGGLLININLSALSPGDSALSISNARVLANDGFGTDVLADCGTTQIKIIEDQIASPQVKALPKLDVELLDNDTLLTSSSASSVPTGTAQSTNTAEVAKINIVPTDSGLQRDDWLSQGINAMKVWFNRYSEYISFRIIDNVLVQYNPK